MNKQMRQYIGILAALISYYVIHEGAHLAYACSIGVFESIRFMGLGVQVVADTQRMTNLQLCGFFGGGDMNGIALLFPEWMARAVYGMLLPLSCIGRAVLAKFAEICFRNELAAGAPMP